MNKVVDQGELEQGKKNQTPAPRAAPFSLVRRKLIFPRPVPLGCDCSNSCCCCSCFPAGTRVLMADGASRPIERLRRGDLVWGLSGVNSVVSVQPTVLDRRRMLQLSDGSLRFSAEHPLWTRRERAQWWGTHDLAEAEWEIAHGMFGGLTRSRPLRALQRTAEAYAHVDGWKVLDAVEVPAASSTALYYVQTDGCHTAIMDGFVVSAGVDDADFDYEQVAWRGLEALRNAEAMLEGA
jgi:hypothetical protein